MRYEVELQNEGRITVYHDSYDFQIGDCVEIGVYPDKAHQGWLLATRYWNSAYCGVATLGVSSQKCSEAGAELQAITGMCQTAFFAVWKRLLRAYPQGSLSTS